MDPKKQLADLMDAFAAAKMSNNEYLQRLVLQQVSSFLSAHDITPISQEAPQVSENSTSWN